jgi:hypothetical protein
MTQPESDASKALKDEVLRSAGYQDPALAFRLLADLPSTPEGDSQVKTMAECLFNGGNALHRFESLLPQAPERLRQPLIDAAFKYLSVDNLDDPQRWVTRLSLLPEASRAQGVESLTRAWAKQSPEDAIEWAGSLVAGETRNGAVAAITSSWAAKDARSAAEWVAAMPQGAERDRGAESLVMTIAERYPQEAWNWALSINDPDERTRAATQAAKMIAAHDPATARQSIEAGPFPPETKMALLSAVERAGRSDGRQKAP